MKNAIENYWKLKLADCREALTQNRFEAHVAADCDEARKIVLETILPQIQFKRVSWGDSMTFYATGVLDALRQMPDLEIIATFDPAATREEIMARRRQALLSDLFFTGSNAVTEAGQLVNLDMIGNRVGGITFGPLHVVLFIGRNKIAPDLEQAMQRVKQLAAPANAIRHPRLKTPCQQTGCCMDCRSPDRICNTWSITEKCFPKGRIKVVLINQDLGL